MKAGNFWLWWTRMRRQLTPFWYLNKGVPLFFFFFFGVIAPVATLLQICSPCLRPLFTMWYWKAYSSMGLLRSLNFASVHVLGIQQRVCLYRVRFEQLFCPIRATWGESLRTAFMGMRSHCTECPCGGSRVWLMCFLGPWKPLLLLPSSSQIHIRQAKTNNKHFSQSLF